MRIEEIMTKKVITLNEWDKVAEIAQTLLKHHLTGAPVVDKEGKVVGIVTEGDLMRRNALMHLPEYIAIQGSTVYLEAPSEIENDLQKAVGAQAEEIMTRDVITASPDSEVEIVAQQMIEKNLNPVPVLENNKIVGIVSKSDIVRLILG